MNALLHTAEIVLTGWRPVEILELELDHILRCMSIVKPQRRSIDVQVIVAVALICDATSRSLQGVDQRRSAGLRIDQNHDQCWVHSLWTDVAQCKYNVLMYWTKLWPLPQFGHAWASICPPRYSSRGFELRRLEEGMSHIVVVSQIR